MLFKDSSKEPFEYFEKRIRSAAELKRLLSYQMMPHEKLISEFDKTDGIKTRCLYIHIPFCRKACDFCGYYKCVNSSIKTQVNYIHKLKKQLKILADTQWVKSKPFDAIYFGGGTPTYLAVNLFAELLESIYQNLSIHSSCEITVESSLNELSESYMQLFRSKGVNRVSLGIQSFNSELRKKHSRVTGMTEIKLVLEKLKGAGIKNICADLMYNLEGQTIPVWENDLKRIAEFGFTGCSLYPLLPFPNAPMVINKTYQIPDSKMEYKYFKIADDYLTSLPNWHNIRTVQYGSFKSGHAKYVQMQAENADVLALGPGAGGRINNIQYINSFSLENYLNEEACLVSGKSRVFMLTNNSDRIEKKLAFFRTGTLAKPTFIDAFEEHKELTNEFIESKLLIENENQIYLSQNGRYWAANLAALVIADN